MVEKVRTRRKKRCYFEGFQSIKNRTSGMAKNKTTETAVSATAFIDSYVENEQKKEVEHVIARHEAIT